MYEVAFSHDGCRILCNVNRAEWTTRGHQLSPPYTDKDLFLEKIQSAAYSPNENEIVCGLVDGTVMIWNMEINKRHILDSHTWAVRSISFSTDSTRIASGSDDRTVCIWDPKLKGPGMINEKVDLGLLRVALSHDGRWIVTASLGHIQVWRVTETMKTNELIIVDDVLSLALSRDSSHVTFRGLNQWRPLP